MFKKNLKKIGLQQKFVNNNNNNSTVIKKKKLNKSGKLKII